LHWIFGVNGYDKALLAWQKQWIDGFSKYQWVLK